MHIWSFIFPFQGEILEIINWSTTRSLLTCPRNLVNVARG